MKEVTKDITLYAHWKIKEIDRANVYDSYLILSNGEEIQFTMNNSIHNRSDNYCILNKNTGKKYIIFWSGLENYKTKLVFKDLENGKKLPQEILEDKKENPDKIEINDNIVIFNYLDINDDYLWLSGDNVSWDILNLSESDDKIYYFDDNFMKMNVSQWEETVYKPIFEKLDIKLTDDNYNFMFPDNLKETERAKLKDYNEYLKKILLNSNGNFSISNDDYFGFDFTYDNKRDKLLNCFKFDYDSNLEWKNYIKDDNILYNFVYYSDGEIFLRNNDYISEWSVICNKDNNKFEVKIPRFMFTEITNVGKKAFHSSWDLLFSFCTDESVLNEIIKSFEVINNNQVLILKENDKYYFYKDYEDVDIEYNIFFDGVLYIK